MAKSIIFRNPKFNISDKSSLRMIDNTPRVYALSPSAEFFQNGILDSSRPIYTSLDTATDDYGHPIAISAFRFQYDDNRNVRIIDSYRRYYEAHNWDMRSTQEYHNFTSKALKSLREQQHASYNKQYDASEIASLQRYLGNSIIIGYGIHQFDFNNLFPYTALPNSTIDLRAAARNIWPDKNSKLKNVFHRVLGNTMEQRGLLPSNPDASSLANIMLLDKMHRYSGEAGEAIRYVMNTSEGRQLVEKDPYLKDSTMVVKGTYRAQFDRHRLSEVYMRESELKAAREEMASYLNNIEGVGGVGEEVIPSTKYETEEKEEEEEISSAVLDTLKWMKNQQKHQGQESLRKKVKEKQSSPFLSNSTAEQELFQEFNQFNNYKRLALIRQVANAGELEGDILLEAAGYSNKSKGYTTFKEMAKKLRKAKESQELENLRDIARESNWRSMAYDLTKNEYDGYGNWSAEVKKYTPWEDKESIYTGKDFDRDETLKKIRYLNKAERSGFLSKKERTSLDNLTGSFDDLADATDIVIQKNQELYKIMSAIGNIKLYDINQYVKSAQSQWSGITGAAKGVVPSFVLNPVSRLGDAFFNSVNAQLTGYNAFQRTWASGIGDAAIAIGGAAGGIPGMAIGMGIKGGISAISQVYGNYKQARMERAGYDIQNSLNVTGALFSWIATPFQLLYKATKLLTGSFGALTVKIKNFIGNSIGLMSQMGNPLTEMTGVNYGDYQGLSMVDIASLFNKGTMNSTIEDYVKQAKALYTTGEVNTSRMIAASMLGIFNDVYDPNASEGSYLDMANKVLRRMQGQTAEEQANTMYWATRIDSSLPSLLRTAQALGVTDIRTPMDPTQGKNWMYWRPLSEEEAGNFRWTQYEYGAATTQLSNSKMRLGDKMWNAFGRNIFNAFNELVDALASSDWDTALNSISSLWKTTKETLKTVWDGFNKDGGLGEGLEKGLAKIKDWGILAATGIINIWNKVFEEVVKRLGGVISYLSTLHLDVKVDKNGISFGISSIKDVVTPGDSSKLYNLHRNSLYGEFATVNEGMDKLTALGKVLTPDIAQKNLTIGDIRERLMAFASGASSTGEYITKTGRVLKWQPIADYLASQGIVYNNPSDLNATAIQKIIDVLYAGSAWDYGFTEQAALAVSGLDKAHVDQSFIQNTPAYQMVQELVPQIQEATNGLVQAITGNSTGKVNIVIEAGDQRAVIETENGIVTNMQGAGALTGAIFKNGMKVNVQQQSQQVY